MEQQLKRKMKIFTSVKNLNCSPWINFYLGTIQLKSTTQNAHIASSHLRGILNKQSI